VKDLYSDYVKVKDGAQAFLKELKESGIKVVAANQVTEMLQKSTDKLYVIEYFEKIFTCTERKNQQGKTRDIFKSSRIYGDKPKGNYGF
jgi:beta-phosphoglucomutase-like phosphatase (HAD superfamily)